MGNLCLVYIVVYLVYIVHEITDLLSLDRLFCNVVTYQLYLIRRDYTGLVILGHMTVYTPETNDLWVAEPVP